MLLTFLAAASPPAGAAHGAVPTYRVNGTTAGTIYDLSDPYSLPTGSTAWQIKSRDGHRLFNVSAQNVVPQGDSVNETASGIVYNPFIGITDLGESPTPPPSTKPVDILVTGAAIAGGSDDISADDALADSATADSDLRQLKTASTGQHLIQVNRSSGTITVGPSAAINRRSVSILSSVDGAFHRDTCSGTPKQVENVAAPDGAMSGKISSGGKLRWTDSMPGPR